MNENIFKQIQIYELNTRIFCRDNECSVDTFPESFFESSEYGAADAIWLMGVWKPSIASRDIARSHTGLLGEYAKVLPDYSQDDIIGSPYAISEYTLNPVLGIPDSLSKMKKRLEEDGKKLILDFVPNHMAIDSEYIRENPDYFLKKENREPCHNSFLHSNGNRYYHGRDPYFDGWTDTVQWDFSNPGVREFHLSILKSLATVCHGVRCDMAMLPVPEIFSRTHGKEGIEYWNYIISRVKSLYPDFIFIGEVYWNMEYHLQQLGFDYTYDKELYDRLKHKNGSAITLHLKADLEYQSKSVRFLENHDEPRARESFGERSIHMMSLLHFLPGAILSYEGQSLGLMKKLPVQLGRLPEETISAGYPFFYQRANLRLMIRKKYSVRMGASHFCCYEYNDYDPSISRVLYYYSEKQIGMAKVKIYNLEFLIYNPEDREISGWLVFDKLTKDFLENLFYENIELEDIISDRIYRKSKRELIDSGIFIKLSPGEAHWFVVDSDLLKEINALSMG